MRNFSFMPRGLWPWASSLVRSSSGRLMLVCLGLAGASPAQAIPTILTGPQSQTNLAGSSVTFSVSATNSAAFTGGFNYGDLDGWPHTNVFYTGRTAGTLNVSYLFGSLNDRMTVYYGGNLIHDTGYVGGSSTRTFSVDYGPGTNTSVTVIINEGNYNNHGSLWEYHLSTPALMYYQWQFNGTNLSGFTNATDSITNINTANAGNYQVVVRDTSGSITSAVATLTVLVPPAITQPPVGMIVAAGAGSNFTVTATGTGPLGYQWQHDGTNIPGATATNYLFTNVQATDAGNYTVVVTNAVGSVTSTPALLKVLISPSLTNVNGSPTNFSFSYATVVGSTYVVVFKSNLDDSIWTPTATNAGTGNLTNFSETITGVPHRFYRVLIR
jgi:hypothetical protein